TNRSAPRSTSCCFGWRATTTPVSPPRRIQSPQYASSMERAILDAIEEAAAGGEQAAVATVVSTFGSAPRQPGAKYVVTEKGRYVGSVSGGCVESDVAERAKQVFAGEAANLIHYGVSDDDAFEVGLSLAGKIDV